MLDVSVLGAFAVNAAIAVALVAVLTLLPARPTAGATVGRRLLAGLVVAGLTVTAMATRVELVPGLQFDVRSVLLGLSGWFLGATPTLIAVGVASLFRYAQGGDGTFHGIAVIAMSGLLGMAFRWWRKPEEPGLRLWHLAAFGVVLPALMAAILATMPRPLLFVYARDALLPIFLINPALTVVVGRIVLGRIRSDQHVEALVATTLGDKVRLGEALGRVELLLEHAPTALAMFDRQLRFVVVSRRFSSTFGLAGEDVVGRLLTSVLPDVPPSIVRAHERALGGLAAESDEEIVHRKGGDVTYQRWASRPWHGADGEIGGMILFTEDVTASVAARTRMTTLAQAVEQSPVSILITDLEGAIEYVNAAFVEATGYARDEVLGKNPRVLASGKTPKSSHDRLWDAITHGRPWTGEFVNKHKDGRDLYQLATVSPVMDAHGVARHFVAVQEDITEKKRLGWELDRYRDHLEDLVFDRTRVLEQARALAESANRAKSAFLANVTHEVRTPLNAIIGTTYELGRDDATPERRARLERVGQAARQLLKTMNEIMDIARIESGDLVLDEGEFALADVTDHVRSLVDGAASDRSLELVIDAGRVPVHVRGDVGRLRQVLLTLTESAVARTDAGRVSIVAGVQEAAPRSLLVRLDVSGTGKGLASDDQERVFDAFDRADPSPTDGEDGSGIGLTLARRLAQLMGGAIEIERGPTGGVRFSLSVRLGRGRQASSSRDAIDASIPEPAPPSEPKARVLVADDDEISLEVARRRLERLGHEVETAPNGRVAVEMARDARYDLILLDLHMPELDGRGACRAIRAMPERRHVRIVALSGSDDEDEARACLADGMDGFVTKPLDATRARELLTGLGSAGHGALPLPAGFVDVGVRDDPELEAGLAVVGGDVDRYRHLLAVFAAAHQGDVRLLEEASASGRIDDALIRLHSLKGAAGSLGQTRLAQVATRIERRAKEAGEVSELELRPLKRELEALSSLILELSRTSAPGTPELDALGANSSDDAQGMLATLAGFLGSDDADAPRYVARHRATLRSAFGIDVDRLVDAIDAYDYETARSLLAKLQTESDVRGAS